MIKLKDYLNIVKYEIFAKELVEDSPVLEAQSDVVCEVCTRGAGWHMICVFDVLSQEVFELIVEDWKRHRFYRWVVEDLRSTLEKRTMWDDAPYTELETEEDILDKAEAIAEDREYDSRVKIPLDISDEEFLKFAKLAHEKDITFNQLMEQAVRAAIDKHQET